MDQQVNRFSFPEIRKIFLPKLLETSQGKKETLLDILFLDLLDIAPGGTSTDLTRNQIEGMERAIEKINAGVPIQYVTGLAHFYGYRFIVDQSVLIPRPETEELVDYVLKQIKPLFSQKMVRILDIGTGSGCIALSLKKNWPESQILGIDISVDALEIAELNAKNLEVEIAFKEDDITNPSRADIREGNWDIIISNPPYVSFSELHQMDTHVKIHEPHTALFPLDGDVLAMYKAIFEYASSHLNHPGFLVVEINEFMAKQIADLAPDYALKKALIIEDMQGKKRILLTAKT